MAKNFKQLYDYCQTLKIKVSRKSVIDKIKQITEKPVRVVKTDLDKTIARGFFLSASNTQHPLVRDNGFNVIVVAHGMNECWDRFVVVKEAMHLLDDSGECTNSAEKFEDLVNTWTYPGPGLEESSPERLSDVSAMLMALACLCPEPNRLEFKQQRNAKLIDDYKIALELKIPEAYVKPLLADDFERDLDRLLQQQ